MKTLKINKTYILFLFLIIISCNRDNADKYLQKGNIIVKDFNPLINWNIGINGKKTKKSLIDKLIYLDYTDAINGFSIPSVNQTQNGFFTFHFYVKNCDTKSKIFFYKIFYQNESYKFPETDKKNPEKENKFAYENFYGSWKDTDKKFAGTCLIPNDNDFHIIIDSFCIIGNPRNEQRYYDNNKNDRWKKNPRVGNYSFLLVVTSEENIKEHKIPVYIQDINKKNNEIFVNPYYYFLYGNGDKLLNTVIYKFENILKVIAKPDLGKGIYINPNNFDEKKFEKNFTDNCGQTQYLYNNAPFQQFIHYIDPSTKMDNIPVIADVLKDNYSKKDYNWNKSFYKKEELIAILPSVAKSPCKTVFSDNTNHKIIIKNPKTSFGKWEKENTGIITRHGFTYGKYTIKAKLSELLNKSKIWNGLTNTMWLFTQDLSKWNYRRSCDKEGYLEHYYGGRNDNRVKNVGYSEIDFEILKTITHCPSYQFPPAYNYSADNQYDINSWNVSMPEEILDNGNKIIVSCTNWDMACWQPENFDVGCQSITYKDKTFYSHRWDHWYRALNQRTFEDDDTLFASDYYYFQIDWQPEKIIWRIGAEKNQLRVVGYMDNTVTSIPDNQMLLIITQEFHNTKWWIGSPYKQENIPFPKNDITGEIFEFTIE